VGTGGGGRGGKPGGAASRGWTGDRYAQHSVIGLDYG